MMERERKFERVGAAEAERPADKYRVNAEDYPIFREQFEINEQDNGRETWNIDKTASRYVTETANLIAEFDGTAEMYRENAELTPPDHVIYLDKSARPVSWLVNTFWKDFSEAECPGHSYLNIDRMPLFHRTGVNIMPNGYIKNPDGSSRVAMGRDFKVENLPKGDIERIRALYLEDGLESDEVSAENLQKIRETPAKLDGKNILIVDEVKRSGSTLEIAEKMIRAAFPEAASVRGTYFWHGGSKVTGEGEHQMLSIPVWYDSKTSLGRGIGELDPVHYKERYEKYPNPKTRAQKFGAFVLSATMDLGQEKGQKSRELMREIQQMRDDYEAGKILLRWPKNYDADRFIDLMESKGVRFAPESDKSPDTFMNLAREIDYRRAE